MKAAKNKVILRYKKADIDAMEKSKGGLFKAIHFDPAKHVCQSAYIEADNTDLNRIGFYEGDNVLVSYLVGYDETHYDEDHAAVKNSHFLYMDGEDEIRSCEFVVDLNEKQKEAGAHFYRQIFGKRTEDGFIPAVGFVFCEMPEPEEIKSNIIFISETAKSITTDKRGYTTKIKYIHPQDAEELGLNTGDEVWCDRNSDIKQNVFGEQLISVFTDRVLGLVEV